MSGKKTIAKKPFTKSAPERPTTVIDGVEYDLSEFIERHPGGSDMVLLAAGRDASCMFHSYHRRLDKARAVLAKLPVVSKTADDGKGKFVLGSHKSLEVEGGVYPEIRKRVNEYFEKEGISSRGGMILKSLLLVGIVGVLYYLTIFQRIFILAPLIGVGMACMGLAIQHDANHGAFHSNVWVNRVAGFMDDIIGGSALMWRHQHVVAHHAHPNDVELDADTFSNFPLMRFNPALPVRWYMKYQHYYGPLMYTLIGVSYPIGDIKGFLSGYYNGLVELHPLRVLDKVQFIVGKILHYAMAFVVPLYVLGFATAVPYVIVPWQLFGGFYLAAVFAVSHNSEGAEYNAARDMDWAEMQIRTSVNWGVDSPKWLYLSGGLNFQIEHHLFPGVAHIHYPAISKIVKQVCKERGLPYNAYPRYRDIWGAHRRQLYKLGHGLE